MEADLSDAETWAGGEGLYLIHKQDAERADGEWCGLLRTPSLPPVTYLFQ